MGIVIRIANFDTSSLAAVDLKVGIERAVRGTKLVVFICPVGSRTVLYACVGLIISVVGWIGGAFEHASVVNCILICLYWR
jgi:hypothetical protein